MNISPVTLPPTPPDVNGTPHDIARIGSLRSLGITVGGIVTPVGIDFEDHGLPVFPDTPAGMADATRAARDVSQATKAAAIVDILHGGENPSRLIVRKLVDPVAGPDFGQPIHVTAADAHDRLTTIDFGLGPLVDGDVTILPTGREDLDGNEVPA